MYRKFSRANLAKSSRARSKSGSDDPGLRKRLTLLESRSYKTYLARQSASVRLGQRARGWNWALVAFSTATTIAAIGMLTKPTMYGPNGATLLVCVSVISLVVSLAVTNMDYSGRSRDMFLNYRKLQRISTEAEGLLNRIDEILTEDLVKDLVVRYQAILDETENHTSGDYFRNLPRKDDSNNERKAGILLDDMGQVAEILKIQPAVSFSISESDHRIPSKSNSEITDFIRWKSIAIDFLITIIPYASLSVPVALFIPLGVSLTP